MNHSLLLSPHDDDNALFASFICLREKPLIIICTDAYIQDQRGEINCDHETRANETKEACKILGCPVIRLGIRDDAFTEEALVKALRGFSGFDKIYAPALQGGNPQHDIVSRACTGVFKERLRYYTTYSRQELWTTGKEEVIPTWDELNTKYKALECYKSQINLPATAPHFEAILGKSEWLI